jgi:hypothetical protein
VVSGKGRLNFLYSHGQGRALICYSSKVDTGWPHATSTTAQADPSSDRGVMSRTIEIPDEIYMQLEQQASMRGLTLPQIIAALVHEEEKARMTTAITRLQTQGLLLTPSSSAPPASPEVEPIQVQGKPLSEVIMEERR